VWSGLLGGDVIRWILAARCPPGPLKSYYRTDTPTLDTPYTRAEFLAVDLETTGLDRHRDDIVSIGFVPIVAGRVRLADAEHHLVRPQQPVSDAAAKIHGLLDDRLAAADPLAAALPRLLKAMTGRIPVAHHTAVERTFLSRACRDLFGHRLAVPWICTLALARRRAVRHSAAIPDGALRLGACREVYGMPRHHSHNALSDALACAELFLAQAAESSGRKPVALRDLIT